MRIASGVEPDADGVRGADQVAIDDLQAPGISGVGRLVADIKIAIHTGQGPAHFGWNGASLFGNKTDAQNLVIGVGGKKREILPGSVNGNDMDGPGDGRNPLMLI